MPGPDHATSKEAAEWLEAFHRAAQDGWDWPEIIVDSALDTYRQLAAEDVETVKKAQRLAAWWGEHEWAAKDGKRLARDLPMPAEWRAVASKIADALDLRGMPELKFFRLARPGEKWDRRVHDYANGYAFGADLVLVKAGMPRRKTFEVLAHELRHAWQAQQPDPPEDRECEPDAYDYGEALTDRAFFRMAGHIPETAWRYP